MKEIEATEAKTCVSGQRDRTQFPAEKREVAATIREGFLGTYNRVGRKGSRRRSLLAL